jgi:hypothetical protein
VLPSGNQNWQLQKFDDFHGKIIALNGSIFQQIIKAVRCSSIQVWYDRYMKPKERCPEMTKPNPQRGKHPLCGMMVD